ncbi:MAG: FtsW/RodA/SpoVE family cell cycle protein, partial [Bacteroidales bacterium]|nr:FtsW/RodA/SpoVE family cell cycle protein [Bacteroidales bacterium]
YTFLSFLRLTKWKRIVYVYLPSIIVCMMMLKGSGSSAIFVGFILVATMFICGVPWKELALAGLVGIAGFAALFAVYKITDGDKMKRIGTVVSRMSVEYDMNRLEGLEGDEFHNMLDTLRQPVSAKVAIYEGRLLGKHTGNSTQKYQVSNIYGDYMYSFLVEEYGLLGGIIILIIYLSVLARSVIISRMSDDEFARYAVGGLALLITGQAFMHIAVNVDLGPMTGQTLPLISHGASAFLVFCAAFGVILSISRKAKNKIQSAEEMTQASKNNIEENLAAAEKIED